MSTSCKVCGRPLTQSGALRAQMCPIHGLQGRYEPVYDDPPTTTFVDTGSALVDVLESVFDAADDDD